MGASRRGAWWTLLQSLVVVVLHGCSGGNQDFGPTRSSPPQSVSHESAKVANSISQTEPVDAVKVNEPNRKAESSATPLPASVKERSGAETDAIPDNVSRPISPEGNNRPVQVAKSATASATLGKNDPTTDARLSQDSTEKTSAADPDSAPAAREPLSSELREWLIAKRRQAGSWDGLAVLTAADLSKVSWHDVRNGELSQEFFGQSGLTTGLLIGPARRWVIGASEAGWLRLWPNESSAGLDQFARASRRNAQASLVGIDTEQEGIWVLVADRQGKWFLTGGNDGSLRICGVEPVRSQDEAVASVSPLAIKLGDKFSAHEGAVTDLEISADGAWMVSGGSDHLVRLWDTKTWATTRTWTESPSQISDVDVSSDGRIVVAACLDKFARWWSAKAPEILPTESETKSTKTPTKANASDATKSEVTEAKPKNGLEHPDIVLSVAISADGQFAATGCQDKFVRVWDLATGQIVEKHDGAKDAIVEVRFLDGDQRLFFRDRSGVVRIKPRARRTDDDDESPLPESKRPFQFVTPSSLMNVTQAAISDAIEEASDSGMAQQLVALRSADSREARTVARHALMKTLNPSSENNVSVKAEQIAALEKQLASVTSDTVKADLKRQISRLRTVAVSQERTERPKLLATLDTNFQFVAGAASQNHAGAHTVRLAIHGDAEWLTATASSAGLDHEDSRRHPVENSRSQLWVWDIATRSLVRHWDDVRSGEGICEFVDSANQLVSSSGHVFSLPTGESRALGEQTLDRVSTVATASDGRHLAVGYAGSAQTTTSVLRLFKTGTLQEVKSHEAFEGLTTAIVFSPDGSSLAVAIRERLLHRLLILDAATLALLATVEEQPHSAPWLQGLQTETRDRGLTTLRFSADGRFLLTHGSYGSGDYHLTLWQKKGPNWTKETAVNFKASQPIVEDTQRLTPLWFVGGKGTQIAAINAKGLGIMDTSNGRLLRSIELKGGFKDRNLVAWSSDGTWLVQGDETGQVTLWNLRHDKEAAVFAAQLGPVKALALSHDGRVLATLGEENKLNLWNLDGWLPKNRVATKF